MSASVRIPLREPRVPLTGPSRMETRTCRPTRAGCVCGVSINDSLVAMSGAESTGHLPFCMRLQTTLAHPGHSWPLPGGARQSSDYVTRAFHHRHHHWQSRLPRAGYPSTQAHEEAEGALNAHEALAGTSRLRLIGGAQSCVK